MKHPKLLNEHLQDLLSRPSGSSRTLDLDLDLIASLQASVDALAAGSKAFSVPVEPDNDNFWTELAESAQVEQDEAWSGQATIDAHPEELVAPASSTSSAAARLESHLQAVSNNDPVIAYTIRDNVLTALQSSKSADEVSVELAELFGFEQLDLVSQLLSDRHDAANALSMGSRASHAYGASELPSGRITFSAPQAQSQGVRISAKPYVPGSQVVIQTMEEKALAKKARNEQRKMHKARVDPHQEGRAYTAEELEQMREESLAAAANRPLFSSDAVSTSESQYPHVFSGHHGNFLSTFGQKFALPVGTTRTAEKFYDEITIPPPRTVPFRMNERLVPIPEMDMLCRGAFSGYKSLNRLQSVVYPLAYKTNENLLICAPTGAGKTDVAMLTILRAISQYARNIKPVAGKGVEGFGIVKNDFKIIYVAPMKALAAEIVRKFSKRLQYLGIKVRELTGDMQMTRQEIAETQVIVTTPEKWDVVTRKPTGEGELATKVRLLIIDEVHLLHENRGAVIETIVARTLRLVESSQSLIRIVGLSATLPNYVDVADFLRVNRYQGLFYFDSSFRPVPLEQHFLGVRGKAGSPQARANLDKAAFEKVSELVQAGHQVMVFVHARKETVKTSQTLRDMFREEGLGDVMTAGRDEHPRLSFFKKELQSSRNKEMKDLFDAGFGIHHAGMLRSDRNISERMFESGVTRVLCCTATLAWGVNLPAYAVVIKGTDVYDSSAGKFVDLSILDVLQIFGRAGRPQYEDLGVGYICTSQDRLSHYVDAITSQHPIESKFISGLFDSLNAEVSLGTVTKIRDGVSWLGYTYLFTRMKRTPLTYGMVHAEVEDDPHLGAKRLQLITSAAKKLVEAKMLKYDEVTGHLEVTEMGRVAAKYYIGYRTIEIFNEKLRPRMSEADMLGILSLGTDFEQIIPRDSEEKELKKLLENCPCEVPGGFETSPGKVNILLQAYISRTYVEDFALVSDSAYVAQNAGRIIRAMFEIALSRRWATTTAALMAMSKAIERRMWPFDHPLTQSSLSPDALYNLTRWADEVEISDLAKMPASEVGKLIHLNDRMGNAVRQAARSFPSLSIQAVLRPLTHSLLKIDVQVKRVFEWNERVHGNSEGFYVWVEDEEGGDILKWTMHVVRQTGTASQTLSFTIPISDPAPSGVSVRWISERWIGSENSLWVSFDRLAMPPKPLEHHALLDLPLLSVSSSFTDELLATLYSQHISAFNALQTQSFHSMVHTKADTLLCAPSASGKTTVALLSAWRAFREAPEKAVLVLYPRKELMEVEAKGAFASIAQQKDVDVNRAVTATALQKALAKSGKPMIIFATTFALLRALSLEGSALLDKLSLVIAEDLHLLDASYEVTLSQLLFAREASGARIRLVGTSSCLDDPTSLVEWLGVKDSSVYNFDPRDRPSSLGLSFQTFDLPHSMGLLKTMIKPTYDKMKECTTEGPAIVYVPSRGQCFTVASDLVTRTASEMDTESFIGVPSQDLEAVVSSVQDSALHEPLMHGFGIYHDGMTAQDQALTLHLFEQGVTRVLITPRESCWNLPARANLVVIMSTQFVRLTKAQGQTAISDREVVDYTLPELMRMQACAIRRGSPSSPSPPGECLILCQSDKTNLLARTMQAGLPLHSTLLDDDARALLPFVLQHIVAGSIKTRGDVLGLLTWSFLSTETKRNPAYYDAEEPSTEAASARLSQHVDTMLEELEGLRAARVLSTNRIAASADDLVEPTNLGRALQLQAGSTLLHVARWHAGLSLDPNRASTLCKSFAPSIKPSSAKQPIEDPAEIEVLKATRCITPGEWLSAFNVPRAKTVKELIAPADQESGESKTEDEFTPVSKAALLLAIFFAKRPLCTGQEARTLKGNRGTKRVAPEEEMLPQNRQMLAKERLESEQAAAILGLLESTSNVGNAPKQ